MVKYLPSICNSIIALYSHRCLQSVTSRLNLNAIQVTSLYHDLPRCEALAILDYNLVTFNFRNWQETFHKWNIPCNISYNMTIKITKNIHPEMKRITWWNMRWDMMKLNETRWRWLNEIKEITGAYKYESIKHIKANSKKRQEYQFYAGLWRSLVKKHSWDIPTFTLEF